MEQPEGIKHLTADGADEQQPPRRRPAARRLQRGDHAAKTSTIATPTPAKMTRLTISTSVGCGRAAVKNRLIGIDAIIASPPQLVVTSAARNVVLARIREPLMLLRMYSAGSGSAQAIPAASVHETAHWSMRPTPPVTPMVKPYVAVPAIAVSASATKTASEYGDPSVCQRRANASGSCSAAPMWRSPSRSRERTMVGPLRDADDALSPRKTAGPRRG